MMSVSMFCPRDGFREIQVTDALGRTFSGFVHMQEVDPTVYLDLSRVDVHDAAAAFQRRGYRKFAYSPLTAEGGFRVPSYVADAFAQAIRFTGCTIKEKSPMKTVPPMKRISTASFRSEPANALEAVTLGGHPLEVVHYDDRCDRGNLSALKVVAVLVPAAHYESLIHLRDMLAEIKHDASLTK